MQKIDKEVMDNLFDGELIEYKIYDVKDINKKKISEDFNLLGQQGWEYCDKLTSGAILFKRMRNYFNIIEKAREIVEDSYLDKDNEYYLKICNEECEYYDYTNCYCEKYNMPMNNEESCLDNKEEEL